MILALFRKETGSRSRAATANIPAIPTLSDSAIMRKSCCIQIDRMESFEEGYRQFKSFSKEDPAGVMLLPYWSRNEGLVFVLLLKNRFPEKKSAEEAMEWLPVSLRNKARIIDGWDEDTVFYRGFGEVL